MGSAMQLSLPLPELAVEAGPAAASERVFCNRTLRLDRIDWVGFDMDYTLAVYRQATMDRLTIDAALEKLVAAGYPARLRSCAYRTAFPIRGLLVDRKLGNILKMDRYAYVKRAYHGTRELTKEERRRAYHTRRLRTGSKRYHWVDTLYALSEVTLYAAVVDALESAGEAVDHDALFGDVRAAVDASHRDGSINDRIRQDPGSYVLRDERLGHTLHRLRSSGKRLFLLTNSPPETTEAMMAFLLAEGPAEYGQWRAYFDLVITAAQKPSFFSSDAPFRPAKGGAPRAATGLERHVVYVGGNRAGLEERLGVTPDRVLYVGDHIYGDVLSAKKQTAWRTLMIVQEMEAELATHARLAPQRERLRELEGHRERLHDALRVHQAPLKVLERRRGALGTLSPAEDAARVRHRRAVTRLRTRLRATEEETEALEERIAEAFHPYWGSLFKAGAEVSSFGHQVEAYAGLYTSRVTNLLRYSPMHEFRSPHDRMPHELAGPASP
ncbi:MAG: HAD-IG family 5'-nucleotidase [Myxococcota bacterium]